MEMSVGRENQGGEWVSGGEGEGRRGAGAGVWGGFCSSKMGWMCDIYSGGLKGGC